MLVDGKLNSDLAFIIVLHSSTSACVPRVAFKDPCWMEWSFQGYQKENAEWLDKPSKEEVSGVIKSFNGNKAP